MDILTRAENQVNGQTLRTKESVTVVDTFQCDDLKDTVAVSFQRNSQVGNKQLFENKILWTIDDLSAFTGLAKQTIYNKIGRKEIPYRKCGRKLRFMPDEILNWIEEGERK